MKEVKYPLVLPNLHHIPPVRSLAIYRSLAADYDLGLHEQAYQIQTYQQVTDLDHLVSEACADSRIQ